MNKERPIKSKEAEDLNLSLSKGKSNTKNKYVEKLIKINLWNSVPININVASTNICAVISPSD